MRLIDADELTKDLTYDICGMPLHGNHKTNYANIRASILTQPTIDIETLPIVRELREQLSKVKWISVKERLPDKGNDVLTYETSKYVGVERIAIDRLGEGEKHPIWMYTTGWFEVTHWMPLPEPPEEE